MPKAKNLKYLRSQAGLTQEKLADELGVTVGTIRSWEHKRTAIPTPATKQIARYFGVTFSDFCDNDLSGGREVLLSEDEMELVRAYRDMDEATQGAVRKIMASLKTE